jgi:membrane-associated phospholipid phosphatase
MTTNGKRNSITIFIISAALLSFTAILLLALALFPGRVQLPSTTARTLVLAPLLYLALSWAARRVKSLALMSTLEVVAVLFFCGILFGQSLQFQQLLQTHWFDDEVITLEVKLFGVEGSLGFQPLVSPVLTEWMMFAYVIYFPLLPAVAWMSYRAGGPDQVRQYLFALAFAWLICYVGFILYPVASPLFWYPDKFTVPLEGGPFTWLGEWGRAHLHQKGGALPSPHCAAGTMILVFAWKYKRWLGIALTPVIVSLYISTVYGRYHYTSDAITGIATAVLVLLLAPRLLEIIERRRRRAQAPARLD